MFMFFFTNYVNNWYIKKKNQTNFLLIAWWPSYFSMKMLNNTVRQQGAVAIQIQVSTDFW